MNNYPCNNNNVKVPISGWIDLHPFKAWCLQILPTIFDESMSYYECLCKLLDIMSATIDDVNLLGQEFVNLKNYVDNYFTNLDVQTEINNKLDEMASNGQLDSIYNRQLTGSPWRRSTLYIGGSFSKNSLAGNNYSLGVSIVANTTFNPYTIIEKDGISLIEPGKSYIEELNNLYNTNPETFKNYKILIYMLEPNDLLYNRSQIESAVRTLESFFLTHTRNSIAIKIVPPLDSTNFTTEELSNFYKACDIPGSNYPYATELLTFTKDTIYNGYNLNTYGVEYFVRQIQKNFLYPLYIERYENISKLTPEGNRIRIIPIKQDKYGIFISFYISFVKNETFDFYIPTGSIACHLLSLNNENGSIIISNGKANLNCPAGGSYYGNCYISYL